MTVEEMLNRMSSREFSEWMAYFNLEPFGEDRDDYRFAMVAQVVANRHRSKRERIHKIEEFLIMKPEKPEGISDEDLVSKLNAFSQSAKEPPNGNSRQAGGRPRAKQQGARHRAGKGEKSG